MENGYIYTTREVNSDNTYIQHNGLPKLGVGRTNNPNRRFEEHHNRGSKSSVGVRFTSIIDCNELNMLDTLVEDFLHTVLDENFDKIDRISSVDSTNRVSTTEVYSGVAKKTIKGVFEKGEKLSEELIKRIVINRTNIDLFKEVLNLFPHQVGALSFIEERFDNGSKMVLLNCKPRSGKSFISYGYLIKHNPKNVLLLTQYPILNDQWSNELENLRGHDYNIIISREIKKVVLDDKRPNLVMISLQDAKGSDNTDEEMETGLKKQKFSELVGVEWDLIIFDEIHKGKETKKTDELLNKLKYKNLIGLSATPTKNILRGTFNEEDIFRYTLKEEQDYKIKFPEEYKNPNINHLMVDIPNEIKEEMKFFTEEEGFTFNKFSRVEDGRLVYENDHIQLFNWFFGKGRNRKLSPTDRVVNSSKSILIFVDNNACQEPIMKILENMVGGVYDVHFTNSDVNSSKKLLKNIKTKYAPKDGRKSIVIANKQLTTGVTLNYCDMVLFMNDWKSIDDYIQATYRCQSPADNKEDCYVVDFNPARAFNILYDYIEQNSVSRSRNVEQEISEYLECAPIFESVGNELKPIDFEGFKNRVLEHTNLGKKFFPKSIIMSIDSIEELTNELLSLGHLKGDNKGGEIVKLDNNGIMSGKNKENGDELGGEKVPSKSYTKKEEEGMMNVLLNNVEFLLDRLHIFGIVTELKGDSMDEVFTIIENNPEMGDLLIEQLMLSELLK
jgi:superfamily II DNA or RNA helicase